MRRPQVKRWAAALAVLALLATAQSATARPPMEADDLPGVRLTYPELLSALRTVRDAYLAQRGTTEGAGPRERLRFGALRASDAAEFPSLDAVDLALLPTVTRDVEYDVSDFGASRVTSVSVAFGSDTWSFPHVYVHGDDAAAMAVVAASARSAFEPHAPRFLSNPRGVKYTLLGTWLLLCLFALVRARRVLRRLVTRKPSPWAMAVGMVPMLAFLSLNYFERAILPNVLAYRPDAGWWARHSTDVLFAAYAGGVTALILVLARLHARALEVREATEASLAVWED